MLQKLHRKLFPPNWRQYYLFGFLLLCASILILQAFFLQFYDTQFLQAEGGKRYIRNLQTPSARGTIYDRNGETIASSAEVHSVWADPSILIDHRDQFPQLAQVLGVPLNELTARLERLRKQRFIWLKRQLPPNEGLAIQQLKIPGVEVQREYRRYYPHTEIMSHLLGFTDIDDQGIEGIEKSYQDWLVGDSARRRVIKDSRGRIVRVLEEHPPEKVGQDLTLTIDHRIQIIAYDALKKAVDLHNAKGGSVIVADGHTGDILAMVNQPAGNPNRIADRKAILLKNKALTDLFEPGSTIKPFIVAMGLDSGKWHPDSMLATRSFRVKGHPITDVSKRDQMSLTEVIIRSSNIGVAKVALSIDPEVLWNIFTDLEIGERSHLGLIGEPRGTKGDLRQWQLNDFEYATKSYGYGLSINSVKLAQIYTVFTNGGVYRPLRIAMHEPIQPEKRIFSEWATHEVLLMMEKSLDRSLGGGGWRARVPKYRVAGKSGTVRKSGGRAGYSDQRHQSFFVAVAPVTAPRYIVSVVIDEPRGDAYYGGAVAGPVISEVMGNTLRILGVRPDDLTEPL